jgi:hypothetical protein
VTRSFPVFFVGMVFFKKRNRNGVLPSPNHTMFRISLKIKLGSSSSIKYVFVSSQELLPARRAVADFNFIQRHS